MTIEAESDLVTKEFKGEDPFYVIDKDIVCTEFAPDIFSFMRLLDGYDVKNLQESLGPEIQ